MSTNKPWWKEPMVWLVLGLPLSAVVAGSVTVWLAVHNADALVSDDIAKEGMAVHADVSRDALAARLHLSGAMSAIDGHFNFDLHGDLHPLPSQLTLRVIHPTQESRDRQFPLMLGQDGRYRSVSDSSITGPRRIIVEPLDQSWRISAKREFPLTGSVALLAAQPDH